MNDINNIDGLESEDIPLTNSFADLNNLNDSYRSDWTTDYNTISTSCIINDNNIYTYNDNIYNGTITHSNIKELILLCYDVIKTKNIKTLILKILDIVQDIDNIDDLQIIDILKNNKLDKKDILDKKLFEL